HFALHLYYSGFLLALSPSSIMIDFGSSLHHGRFRVLPPSWRILDPPTVVNFGSSCYRYLLGITPRDTCLDHKRRQINVLIVGGVRSTSSL
ncbi:unnamed protein product, partial [Musa hybrid cultivar]